MSLHINDMWLREAAQNFADYIDESILMSITHPELTQAAVAARVREARVKRTRSESHPDE